MSSFDDLPTKEPLVLASPRDHPLAGKLPKLFINPRWQQWFGNLREDVDLKPSRKATVNLTAQTATLGLTPIVTATQGLWRISYNAAIVVPASISSSLEVVVTWTQRGVTIIKTAAAMIGNVVTEVQFGTLIARADADTPMSVSTIYASSGTPMQYSLDVSAEELAAD